MLRHLYPSLHKPIMAHTSPGWESRIKRGTTATLAPPPPPPVDPRCPLRRISHSRTHGTTPYRAAPHRIPSRQAIQPRQAWISSILGRKAQGGWTQTGPATSMVGSISTPQPNHTASTARSGLRRSRLGPSRKEGRTSDSSPTPLRGSRERALCLHRQIASLGVAPRSSAASMPRRWMHDSVACSRPRWLSGNLLRHTCTLRVRLCSLSISSSTCRCSSSNSDNSKQRNNSNNCESSNSNSSNSTATSYRRRIKKLSLAQCSSSSGWRSKRA